MAVTLTLTGSGTVGDITPGWTVQEETTPVSPADSNGSVGSVSLSALEGTNSEFVIDNASTFTHDVLGSISGKVGHMNSHGATDQTSTTVDMDLTTRLSKLTADAVAPPQWRVNTAPADFLPPSESGNPQSMDTVRDIAVNQTDGTVWVVGYRVVSGTRVYGFMKYTAAGVYVMENLANGTGAGQFSSASNIAISPVDGSVYVTDVAVDGSNNMTLWRIQKFNSSGTYVTSFGTIGTGNGQVTSAINPSVQTETPIAVDTSGNIFVVDPGSRRIQKFNSSGVYQAQYTNYYPLPTVPNSDAGVLNVSDISINPVNNDIFVSFYYRRTTTTSSALSNYTPSSQIMVFNSSMVFQRAMTYPFAQFSQPYSGTSLTFAGFASLAHDAAGNLWASPVRAYFAVKYDSTTFAELDRYYQTDPNFRNGANETKMNIAYNATNGAIYVALYAITPNSFNGGVYPANNIQSFAYAPLTLSTAIRNYLNLIDATIAMNYTASSNPNVIFPGWTGSVWAYLKDLCAAYNLEIGVVNDVVTIRNTATRVLSNENIVAGTAQLDLDTNATGLSIDINYYQYSGGSSVVYNSPTVLQVAVGETNTQTIVTNNYYTSVAQPFQTDAFPIQPGEFFVIGSDNLPVLGSQFRAYGGRVQVVISATVPGALDVTLTGPTTQIPGVLGPYSFAVSDGNTTYPAFSVVGQGVFPNKKTLNLLTGADSTKTAVKVATTVDNVFISTIDQAYDRGVWATIDAAGPTIVLTCSMPTSSAAGFGLVAGSRISFKNSLYRVTAVSIRNGQMGITAKRHVTTNDFETVATGRTAGNFDTVWSTNQAEDFHIKPLLTI